MSWSLSTSDVEAEELESRIKGILDDQNEQSASFEGADEDVLDAQQEQQKLAIEAVKQLAESGEFGDGPYGVSLSGHVPPKGTDQLASINIGFNGMKWS